MLIFNSNTSEEMMTTGTCIHPAGAHLYNSISNHLCGVTAVLRGLPAFIRRKQPDLLISLWLYLVMVVSDRYSSIPYRYRQTGGIVPQCVLLSEASGPTQSKLEADRPVSQIIGYN
jgi:hypothetical protein